MIHKKHKKYKYSKMQNIKKSHRKIYDKHALTHLYNDLAPTYPVGGRFLNVGDMELLLTKTSRKDEDGNAIYAGTLVKRKGLFKRKVSHASHIAVKKL